MLLDKWESINVAIANVIGQIIHYSYSSELKKLFLLSKSIELLVLTTECYEHANKKKRKFH